MSAARPSASRIWLKRVYDAPTPGDGYRVLVDRLWPRGLTKQKARVDLWPKDVAPSVELRRWYHKDLTRWPEFRKRYEAELNTRNNIALDDLRKVVREYTERGASGVTLLYGSANEKQNHAIVLLRVLERF